MRVTASLYCNVLVELYQVHVLTCSEPPLYPYTLGTALCRHNVVVVSVSFELQSEGDGGILTCCGGDVPYGQVGEGRVSTIVNSAVIPCLKCTLHKSISWIRGINTDSKNVIIHAICGEGSISCNDNHARYFIEK